MNTIWVGAFRAGFGDAAFFTLFLFLAIIVPQLVLMFNVTSIVQLRTVRYARR